jgi:hypothetical protein
MRDSGRHGLIQKRCDPVEQGLAADVDGVGMAGLGDFDHLGRVRERGGEALGVGQGDEGGSAGSLGRLARPGGEAARGHAVEPRGVVRPSERSRLLSLRDLDEPVVRATRGRPLPEATIHDNSASCYLFSTTRTP